MRQFKQGWPAGMVTAGLLAQLVSGGAAWAAPPAPASPTVEIRDDGLWVTWEAPAQVDFMDGPGGTVIPALAGLAPLARPGWPQLPAATALVALPPEAGPALEIVSMETRTVALPGPLGLAPAPEGVVRDEAGRVLAGAFAPAATAHFSPDQPVTLEPLGVMRGVRLARLTFYPLRPLGGALQLTTRLVVHVRFAAPPGPAQHQPADPVLPALRQAVLNPDQVGAWPASRPAGSVGGPGTLAAAQGTAIVEVARPGLTVVTYAALAAAGFDLAGVDPARLRLTRAGAEVALEWQGDNDTAFEPGEQLLFYAAPRFSRWTRTDAYFLSAGPSLGLRMSQRAAAPTGLPAGVAWAEQAAEVDRLYTPDCLCAPLPPGRDGERWAWESLARPGTSATTKTVSLPAVAVTQPATLTVWALGYTNVAAAPDHRLNVVVNGMAVGQVDWDGKQAITATLALPAGLLTGGTNTVTLALPGLPGVAVDGAWLDAFALQFALSSAPLGGVVRFTGQAAPRAYTLNLASTAGLRAYDITDPDQPVRLTSLQLSGDSVSLGQASPGTRTYALVPEAALQQPARVRLATALPPVSGADYVLIAPGAFVPALAPLIQHRQQQGLSVALVELQAIYDAVDGRPTPEAIRAYLAEAYAAWNPWPAYALLVGDGTLDPKRYRENSFETVIPPYLAEVDPWAGETAADNLFVSVDGDDHLPDMLIGRLPVNSVLEVQAVVAKIVHYEGQPYTTGWNAAAVFVADDADAAGDHPAQAASLAGTFVPAPFVPRLVEHAPPATPVTATQQAVLAAWHAGAGLMVYAGHASTHQWAAERLFHDSEVALLANGPRLPVVVELTCFTGSFHVPGLATLDEALVRQPAGGAIAAWGSTGLGVSTGHAQLAAGFLQALYDGETLGTAALAGKLNVAAHRPDAADLIDTFGLLGDPATRLFTSLAPWPATVFMPTLTR